MRKGHIPNRMDSEWMRKPVDIQYLLDSGLLFEINRSILHLLGIAMVVKKNEQGELKLELKDSRLHPEQLIFNEEVFKRGKTKIDIFMEDFGYEQIRVREIVYGTGCQRFCRYIRKHK